MQSAKPTASSKFSRYLSNSSIMLRADDAADDAIEIGEISVNNVTEDCSMVCQLNMSPCTCVLSASH